jgi:hypothetical protein
MGQVLTAEALAEETSIASRAMKAVFHRGVGAARRVRDNEAESLVKDKLGDQGQIVTKKLFTNKQGLIYRRNQLANEMYGYHVKATLPHGDDGSRLLPNSMYFEYTQRMSQFEHDLRNLDQQIVMSYDQLVAVDVAERNAALISQGKNANAAADEYPDLEQIQRYMYVEWVLEPISTANDFRYDVAPEVKDRLNSRLKQIAIDAKADIFARMAPPMKHFIEKLSVPIGEKGGVFRDSLVENLNELLTELPKLNFDNDPRVAEVLTELKKLVQPYVFNPDALREVPEVRSAARQKMEELMRRLDGYKSP